MGTVAHAVQAYVEKTPPGQIFAYQELPHYNEFPTAIRKSYAVW